MESLSQSGTESTGTLIYFRILKRSAVLLSHILDET